MKNNGVVSLRSVQTAWRPLIEAGVDTTGVYIKSLRYDKAEDRSPTILLKLEPGAGYPYHNHPGGEEIFVLEGEVTVGSYQLKSGDYLYTPPGECHDVKSESGCILLAVIPQAVEIIQK